MRKSSKLFIFFTVFITYYNGTIFVLILNFIYFSKNHSIFLHCNILKNMQPCPVPTFPTSTHFISLLQFTANTVQRTSITFKGNFEIKPADSLHTERRLIISIREAVNKNIQYHTAQKRLKKGIKNLCILSYKQHPETVFQ